MIIPGLQNTINQPYNTDIGPFTKALDPLIIEIESNAFKNISDFETYLNELPELIALDLNDVFNDGNETLKLSLRNSDIVNNRCPKLDVHFFPISLSRS